MFFLDSSALVKLYVEETGSERVESLLAAEPAGSAVISRLAVVEAASALTRRMRKGDLTAESLAGVLRLLDSDVQRRFRSIEIGGATIARALQVIDRHALRTADAIQLACALLAAGDARGGGDETVVSSDRELNAAAEREGFRVVNPTIA